MKFIHCSDLHIDSPLDGLERYPGAPVDALRGATREALSALVDLAVERAVDFVAIAGDVFDGDWRDMNTGLFFASQMRRLDRAGIPVYLKRGNHDAASEVTRALALPDNVHEFPTGRAGTFRLESAKVALHGRSFADRAVPEDLAAGYPPPVPGWFNVGVLHTSLAGYASHDPYAPTSLDVLRGKGYDYWALGHVHAREVLQEAHPRIVYSGNLQGRHAGEPGPKGCELVEWSDGELRAEPVALDVLRWEVVGLRIDGLADVDAFRAHAHERMREAQERAQHRASAWRVVVEGTGALHRWLAARPDEAAAELRSIADGASGGRAWIERIACRTRLPAAARAHAGADDPIGECLRLVGELLADPAALRTFGDGALRDLVGKLPPPLKGGPRSVGLDDPEVLAGLLREAESMLLDRLAGEDAR
ncbi:MAG TPA: DNA repair exonuclease [Burkholderiaceae bacterium]|nr:DNA repair exonuclease [Burkholderiaceae bacterium]